MSAPTNERQSLERESGELPGQLAAHQGELDATAPGHKVRRRERLLWQLRRVQKRMADIEARLASADG